jgi:hypothetical protein
MGLSDADCTAAQVTPLKKTGEMERSRKYTPKKRETNRRVSF